MSVPLCVSESEREIFSCTPGHTLKRERADIHIIMLNAFLGGPMGVPARGNLASRNQSIGIKVLDIKDQPLSFKDARKRKKDEEEKERKVRNNNNKHNNNTTTKNQHNNTTLKV